jgi:hypothetical protein
MGPVHAHPYKLIQSDIAARGITEVFDTLNVIEKGMHIHEALCGVACGAAWQRDNPLTHYSQFARLTMRQRRRFATDFKHLKTLAPQFAQYIPDHMLSHYAGQHWNFIEAPFNQHDSSLNPSIRPGERLSKAEGRNMCTIYALYTSWQQCLDCRLAEALVSSSGRKIVDLLVPAAVIHKAVGDAKALLHNEYNPCTSPEEFLMVAEHPGYQKAHQELLGPLAEWLKPYM